MAIDKDGVVVDDHHPSFHHVLFFLLGHSAGLGDGAHQSRGDVLDALAIVAAMVDDAVGAGKDGALELDAMRLFHPRNLLKGPTPLARRVDEEVDMGVELAHGLDEGHEAWPNEALALVKRLGRRGRAAHLVSVLLHGLLEREPRGLKVDAANDGPVPIQDKDVWDVVRRHYLEVVEKRSQYGTALPLNTMTSFAK